MGGSASRSGGPTFSDLVDTDAVRAMMENFYAATGFVVGIVDRDGKIVVQVGYRDICTRFHRACPASERECVASDVHINSRLVPGSYVDYTCANGLIDAASPIVIDGEHLATIYTGQFFFDQPDEAFFVAQAERYGYDLEAYRAALREVPVVSRTQYESVMGFLTRFAEMMAELGLEAKRRRQTEAALRQADKMEAVGRLAGGVAHDLNNMLQVILGHGEVARLRLDRGIDVGRSLAQIMEAASRAQGLVSQLLTFGRKSETERRPVDLPDVVRGLVKLVQRLIGEPFGIEMELDSEVPPIEADPGQIEQVLMNLCLNARDAMAGGGAIRIRVSTAELGSQRRLAHPGVAAPHGLVALEVSDTGTGIEPEHLEHIFEPFFTTKGPGRGTGLGLATVYAVAEQHGGFVEVESTPGEGTTFRMLLPAGTVASVEGPGQQQITAVWPGGAETVLIAEDERLVREFTRHTLSSAGYHVVTAADGVEAVERFQSDPDKIDILVFDVIMPRMNGRDAYEHIRGLRPGIPVLFCSAYTQDLLRHEYTLDLPAGHLLQKPFTPRSLLLHVRRLLDGVSGGVDPAQPVIAH